MTNQKIILATLSLALFSECCVGVSDFLERSLKNQVPKPSSHVTVRVGFYVSSVSGIHTPEAVFEMDVFYRQYWVDERLAWNSSSPDLDGPVTIEDLSHIWVPDGYFVNAKSVVFHDQPIPNFLFRVHSDGLVFYAQRLTVTIPCAMDIRKYPFDVQVCPIIMESSKYITSQVSYKWGGGRNTLPVTMGKNINTQKHFVNVGPEFEENVSEYSNGNYSQIKFHLLFDRHPLKSLLNDYFPTLFLVILSWTNFWISDSHVPARTALCITIVLSHITKAGSMMSRMPDVTYVTSMDIWLLICLSSHFFVFVEFTVAHVVTRRHQEAEKSNAIDKGCGASVTGHHIDRISRVVFPVVFTIVTSVYIFFIM